MCSSDWKSFRPHSNVLWLYYLTDMIIERLRSSRPPAQQEYIHEQWKADLKLYSDRILENPSAKEVYLNVFSPEAVKRIGRAPTVTAEPEVAEANKTSTAVVGSKN